MCMRKTFLLKERFWGTGCVTSEEDEVKNCAINCTIFHGRGVCRYRGVMVVRAELF